MSSSTTRINPAIAPNLDRWKTLKIFLRRIIGIGDPKITRERREPPCWRIHASDQPIGRDQFWSWSNEEAIEKVRDLNLAAYEREARASLKSTALGNDEK